MARDRLPGWPRRLLHAVLLIGGWALFFYWWYLVAVRDWNRTLIALIILVTLLVAPAVTLGWVAHNVNIFRRKGPRLGAPRVSFEYDRDWNGREVVADWKALGEESVVVVSVDEGRKHYAAGAERRA